DIHEMNAVVAELAVAEVPKPVPVVMDQIFVIRLHRGRSHPEIPPEPCGRFLWFLEADRVTISGEKEVGLIDVADGAVVDQLNRLAKAPAPAALSATGSDALVLARCLDQLRTFPNIVGDGLLYVDVLAGLHRPNGGEGVPMVWRGDGDRVDFFIVENAAHVRFDLGMLPGFLEDCSGRGLGAASI